MSEHDAASHEEPTITVGLLDDEPEIRFSLSCPYAVQSQLAVSLSEGIYSVKRRDDTLQLTGDGRVLEAQEFTLIPTRDDGEFRLTTEIGKGFHWAEYEEQAFPAELQLIAARAGRGVTAINRLPMERYLTSVICSEMSSSSPRSLLEAHAVVSRSWLLARRVAKSRLSAAEIQDAVEARATVGNEDATTVMRWYDSIAHADFDVCAEDHCQRYHGTLRVANPAAEQAIAATRGLVLMHDAQVCETVYSKCCGGRSEDARVAWSDAHIPYLMPVDDQARDARPLAHDLTREADFRAYLDDDPPSFCNCKDEEVLALVLPPRDQRTRHFYRWTERLSPKIAGELVRQKLGHDLGPVRAIEPVRRGASGRLQCVRLVGERATLTVGKELEIRRALSPSHLYSSAFAVDLEGPAERPDALVLRGAGWGHGVGLCQVGAAVMAYRGYAYESILDHYYPHTTLASVYA
ncbi:MAG: SpoIID/LytB domain-containing protein [Pseudomonadota bacterium]